MSEQQQQRVPFYDQPRGFFRSIALRQLMDGLTGVSVWSGALSMIILLGVMSVVIVTGAWPAVERFGLAFIWTSDWDPVRQSFGAWPVIYGTLVSSAIALLIAVPISVGSAIFLIRLSPKWLSGPASFLIELLAAIPSITYGLWGAFVLAPALQSTVMPWAEKSLGKIPVIGGLFQNDFGSGFNMLTAGIILAIMVTPIITAVTRDVLKSVPPELEQGAIGLGATWWQATWVVLNFSKMGIFGAIILGLARAIGETMAVTMVIGNTIQVEPSLFAPGQTIASLLANQFREADTPMFTHALVYTALLLLIITALINGLARLMIVQVSRRGNKRR